jgi:RHS repeat-associated protein
MSARSCSSRELRKCTAEGVVVGRNWGASYYRARYYDPVVGRFIGEDSARFKAGINFYPYVQNDPLNYNDPTALYKLVGFTAPQQVDMMNAIADVKKMLEDCPSCVADPSIKKQLLGFLGGGNNASGVTFIYEANLKEGCGGTVGVAHQTKIHDWTKGACDCLPSTIMHELVHNTWHNILTPPIGNWAEKTPYKVQDACYPHPHGAGCKF